MKILHITPNNRTAQIIKSALAKSSDGITVRPFPLSLLYGCLPYRITAQTVRMMTFNGREQDILDFLALQFNEFDKVIVWHSNDAESKLLLYLMCSLNIPLYYINATDSRYLLLEKGIWNGEKILPMGNMPEMGIRHLLHTENRMTVVYRRYAAACWFWHTHIRCSYLRVLNRRGCIVHRPIDYYDTLILANSPNQFMNVTYTIGLTIADAGRSGNIVHDLFVLQRIQYLIEIKLIEARNIETSTTITLSQSTLPEEISKMEIRKV